MLKEKEILPNIYLSGLERAEHGEFLRKKEITHIINVSGFDVNHCSNIKQLNLNY